MHVKVKRLNPQVQLPKYMTEGAAGCDVYARLETPISLQPACRVAVSTGLAFEIPRGFEIQVRPRSGLALKSGVTVINAPGTIDSDYRGELKVLLVNHGQDSMVIQDGDRIAQLVLGRVEQIQWGEATDLGGTSRSSGGFGSTG